MNNSNRLRHYQTFRAPTPDEKGYKELKEFYNKKIKDNPKSKKELEKNFKKASRIVATQTGNGIGFLQDQELRFFLNEFNNRAWNYGFGSMPSSFNILEGFFRLNQELFCFELLEEEEHLFSLFDFLDFATSSKCSNSTDYFIENAEEGLIYSYNIHNDIKDLTFSTTDSREFVVGGVSFVKRGNEAFMLLIAGEVGDTETFSQEISSYHSGNSGKSYIEPGEGRYKEAVKLFDKDDLWKVNIYLRLDLERKSIDLRYVQKDTGEGFLTYTDDYGMLKESMDFDEGNFDELFQDKVEEIIPYEPIFEVAYNLFYLPEYFDFHDDQVLPEEHPTGLNRETIRGPGTKRNPKFAPEYFYKTQGVWILDKKINTKQVSSLNKNTELRIEKNGYWKNLEPGKIGIDKNGNEIHNRTWVEKTLTWSESKRPEKDIDINIPNEISNNQGYIYILRNPAHEENIFKIGLTTNPVEKRAKQLHNTSSPDSFLIVLKWHTLDCVLAEKLIHEKLENFRINKRREFFRLNLEEIVEKITPIIEQINGKQRTT